MSVKEPNHISVPLLTADFMLLKSWETLSLFFQRSESVSSLRSPDLCCTRCDGVSSANSIYGGLNFKTPSSLIRRQSEHMGFTSTDKTMSYKSGAAVALHAFAPQEWRHLRQKTALSGGTTFPCILLRKWWQTRSVRCFGVIKTLIEANTSAFRRRQSRTLRLRASEGREWGWDGS